MVSRSCAAVAGADSAYAKLTPYALDENVASRMRSFDAFNLPRKQKSLTCGIDTSTALVPRAQAG